MSAPGTLVPPVDAIRADVGHAKAALIRLDEQLTRPEPDLFVVEGELQLARKALVAAERIVDTEIVRAQR